MTQQGATLQNYNNELVKCIEDLREKREEVNRSIAKDEEEKGGNPSPTPVDWVWGDGPEGPCARGRPHK